VVDCESLDEGGNILDVKLMSANDKGFLIVPKVDSVVVVSFMFWCGTGGWVLHPVKHNIVAKKYKILLCIPLNIYVIYYVFV